MYYVCDACGKPLGGQRSRAALRGTKQPNITIMADGKKLCDKCVNLWYEQHKKYTAEALKNEG